MKLDITGRHIDITPAIRDFTRDKLSKLDKWIDDVIEAHVVLFVEKHRHTAEVVVKSRHSDPRSGETVYRLTNINRSEPDHSLFEVPSDYSIKDQPGADMKMRFEKEVQVQQRRNEKQ